MTPRQREIKELLLFSDRWLELGVLTAEELDALADAYETSGDRRAEHYRFGVFHGYLTAQRPLSADIASALYGLASEDPDPYLAGSMMHHVLLLPECPDAVIEQALTSGETHLVRLATRKQLLKEISLRLTAKLFEQCIAFADETVQRELLDRMELSKSQLDRLVEAGATRAVRNLATVKLKRWKDSASSSHPS